MSETTNLKLFKHDEPLESNINEFDIDEALNNNWDKIDATVEDLKEEQTKQNEDIESLQEENANLKAQIPTGQASGEEISLQDSAKMELVDFGLQGNSKQETTKGLQILENTNEGINGWSGLLEENKISIGNVIEDNIDCVKFTVVQPTTANRVLLKEIDISKLKANTPYTLQFDIKSNKTTILACAIQTTAAEYIV